jgi:hypothetical protein
MIPSYYALINKARFPSLRACFLFNEQSGYAYDAVTQNRYVLDSKTGATNSAGTAIDFAGASTMISLGERDTAMKAGPATIITVGEYSAASSTEVLASYSLTNGWALKSEQYNNTGKIGFTKHGVVDLTSNLTLPTSGVHSISAIIHADNDATVFLDNEHELLGNTAAINTSGVNNLAIGGTRSNGDLFKGKLNLVLFFDSDIGASVVKEIHANPEIVFYNADELLFDIVASGGAANPWNYYAQQ